MRLAELLHNLLLRFQAAGTGNLLIGYAETLNWPQGALKSLVDVGLLHSAEPVKSLICAGCEEACVMPVKILPGSHPRAYIVCDRRDDVARVPVDLEHMRQWRITQGTLIQAVIATIDMPELAETEIQSLLAKLPLHRLFIVEGKQISVDQQCVLRALEPDTGSDAGRSFTQTGDHWTICYQGQSVTLTNTMGLRYIAYLLRHQGDEIHVRDLYYAINPPSSRSDPTERYQSSMSNAQIGQLGLSIGDLGDAGETLPPEGKKQLEAHVRKLQEQIDEAAELGDVERQAELEMEQEKILRYLTSESGLGGRPRKASSEVERLRKSVTKRIRDDIHKIAQHHTTLGHHMKAEIRTGTQCRYAPHPPIEWIFHDR